MIKYLNTKIYRSTNETAPWCLDTRTMYNGKYLGRRYYFKTKADATYKKDELMESGELNIATSLTTAERKIIDVYYEFIESDFYRKKNKKPGKNRKETIRDKKSRLENYLLMFIGDSTVADIDEQMLIDVTSYIKELENEDGEQISEYLQYRLWVDFKSVVNYCIDKKYITKAIPMPIEAGIAKPDGKKPESWSKEEYDLFINEVDEDIYKLFFLLLGLCGPRKSEARGIKFKMVDFINKKIKIETQLKDAKEGDRALKTKDSYRNIDVPEIVLNGIKKEMDRRLKTGMSYSELMEQYIFVDDKNNPLPYETVRRKFNKYVKKARIKQYPIHNLRHYYATQALRNGASTPYVQDQLGHSRKDVTIFKHYTAVAASDSERNLEILNKMYPLEEENNDKE